FEQLRADNVIYAETRFAPLLHTAGGLSAEEVVTTVEEALSEVVEATGVESRLILCALRDFTAEDSLETAKLVDHFRDTRVAALDLAGDEAGFPLDAHLAAFRYAAEQGLPRVAHAGEASGAESVRQTLDLLQPSRISHGVRSVEDPELIERLRRESVHLEVCPTCNVQIDIYPSYADHPVDRLYRAGIPVSVNTDTRTVTNVSLNEEYERLHVTFGWSEPDFLQCNLEALEAAFLPEQHKRVLKEKLRKG
ncbi:MAG: adenosine deaminase, partial [Rubrobacter sp.]|nr:adenosine deaminase [Rubrobacter sp.]